MEQNREPINGFAQIYSTIVWQSSKGERIDFLASGAGMIVYTYGKKWTSVCILCTIYKINSKVLIVLNTKPKTINVLEENIETYFVALG